MTKKTSMLVLFLCLAISKAAFAYSINLSGGTTGFNAVNIPNLFGARHWDAFSIENTPGEGEYLGFLFGNNFSLGSYVSVLPEPGDLATGTIQLSLHYQIAQQLTLSLTNYQATQCDFHYDFQLAVRPDAFSPALAFFSLSPGSTDVVFDYEVGAQIYLDFVVDAGSVHQAHENWSWHPDCVNPASPGLASLEISGAFTPVSLQVIPEPSGLALGALGFGLMGLWSAAKQRRNLGPKA